MKTKNQTLVIPSGAKDLLLLGLLFAIPYSLFAPAAYAQGTEANTANDAVSVAVGRGAAGVERVMELEHPYHVVARHPKPGCAVTSECGDIFMDYYGHNIRTTAGTDWQAQVMCKLSSPPAQCNYIALTNTAITPAIADTTLSGEISSNGLSRAQATYADTSAGLSTPGAPTVTVRGTTGSTSYWYWVEATNSQGGTVLSSSGTTSTANATLSTTNYVDVSWTAVTAATGYKVWRTTSSSAPSGSTANLVQNSAFCNGTACHVYDISNSLNTDSIPASQQTYAGSLTLVYTWTATGAQSAQAFGVFNAASTGTLCFEGTFTQVSLNINDTLQITETIYF